MGIESGADELEHAAIHGAILLLTNGLLNEADLNDMIERFSQTREELGPMARLQMLGARLCADQRDREAAFSLAAAVALADDKVVSEETATLETIAEWFGISNRRRESLLLALD